MVDSILHILAPGPVGGAERVVEALAIGQHRRGLRVAVAAVLDSGAPEHPLVRAMRAAGVAVHPVVCPPRRYLRERQALTQLIRAFQPGVVHTHGYRADVIGGSAAKRLGVPAVTTVHGFTGGGWKNRFYERLQRGASRGCDAVAAVSGPLEQHLVRAGVPSDRVHLLPNGWGETSVALDPGTARRELGVPARRFVVGWVGRLSHEKGADVLLDAIPMLQDISPLVTFLGDGRERARLESQSTERGLGESVRWVGAVADAGRLFPAFDVFVLSSRTEGTPIVLFEAMAAGAPIVASRVGGVPDVISPEEGLLVPPEDPAALAAGIRRVHDDPASALARSTAARERLHREFSLQAWLDGYDAFYRAARERRLGISRAVAPPAHAPNGIPAA